MSAVDPDKDLDGVAVIKASRSPPLISPTVAFPTRGLRSVAAASRHGWVEHCPSPLQTRVAALRPLCSAFNPFVEVSVPRVPGEKDGASP